MAVTINTIVINVFAAVLIAARVLYFQRYIKPAGSERNSQYTTIIIICIESAALIILISLLYIVLVVIQSPASFIFMLNFVHINVRHGVPYLFSKNMRSYVYLKKILGHIAASNCI